MVIFIYTSLIFPYCFYNTVSSGLFVLQVPEELLRMDEHLTSNVFARAL